MTEDMQAIYRQRIDAAIDDRGELEALQGEVQSSEAIDDDQRGWLLEHIGRYLADLDDTEEILPDEPERDTGAGA